MDDKKIEVSEDLLLKAQDGLKERAVQRKTQSLMNKLNQINRIELNIKREEKEIESIREEIRVINDTDISEFIYLDEGESWFVSSGFVGTVTKTGNC